MIPLIVYRQTSAISAALFLNTIENLQLNFQIDKPIYSEGSLLVWVVIDAHESYNVRLQDGKQVEVSRYVYSKDGKTMRATIREYDPQGNHYESEPVWEKQQQRGVPS